MKKSNKLSGRLLGGIKIMLLAMAFCHSFSFINAQQQYSVAGKITDSESNEALLFATVALLDSTGLQLISGGVTNMEGEFFINCGKAGSYILRISAIGYESVEKKFEIGSEGNFDLGHIYLNFTDIAIDGVTITGDRIKARTELDKTVYFVNRKMHEASNTGIDVLKLIPGVQMDFRQNISLEGSQDIIILINGKERDKSYISQLNAKDIDIIEVISNPSSKYDASVTGVVNIILTKASNKGMEGQVYVELPTSGSEVYLFPVYSLNYGFNKLNLFTSYNGELSYFDVHENVTRRIIDRNAETGYHINQMISNQYNRQKTWSHRFHYGLDYFLNDKNQLNFYAFYNPFSNEHSGVSEIIINGEADDYWLADKDDSDINQSAFYSLYYKHLFNESTGHAIDLDVSYYTLKGENTTGFVNEKTGYSHTNTVEPGLNWNTLRIDYTLPLTERLKFNSGIRSKFRSMENGSSGQFQYTDQTLAAYGSLSYSTGKFDIQAGLRIKEYTSKLYESHGKGGTAILPSGAINFRYSSVHNIRFTSRSAVTFPHFYQLNPYRSADDPFSYQSGNPDLDPVLRNSFSLEHSMRFRNNFINTGLFYNMNSDVISNLILLGEDNKFESTTHNLGNIDHYGLQISGALNITRQIAFNPYLKLFESHSIPNSFARQNNITSRRQLGWASGFSAVVSLVREITASIIFQYESPVYEIQSTSFNDALYFISFEKSFNNGFKAGLTSAVPLKKSLTYHSTELNSDSFYSRSSGSIKMSAVPVWLKVSYQFSAGTKRARVERTKEEIEKLPGKGF